MKTINKVEWILKQSQLYRDSDKDLLMAYWESQGLLLSESQKQIFRDKCATPETITRARRALKAKYPASDKVDDARFQRYKEYRFHKAYQIVED